MDKHLQKAVDIVEKLLQVADPNKHNDAKSMLLWQRGYLTGLLAVLIRNDSLTRRQLTKRIEHHLKKK